jgi:meiotic recombination protein SPO11
VIALQVAHQVLSRRDFSMEVPSRAASKFTSRMGSYRARGKRSSRTFLNVKEAKKSAITLRVMQFTTVLLNSSHYKRDLFYTDVKLFVDQSDSDGSWTTWRLSLAVPSGTCTW